MAAHVVKLLSTYESIISLRVLKQFCYDAVHYSVHMYMLVHGIVYVRPVPPGRDARAVLHLRAASAGPDSQHERGEHPLLSTRGPASPHLLARQHGAASHQPTRYTCLTSMEQLTTNLPGIHA